MGSTRGTCWLQHTATHRQKGHILWRLHQNKLLTPSKQSLCAIWVSSLTNCIQVYGPEQRRVLPCTPARARHQRVWRELLLRREWSRSALHWRKILPSGVWCPPSAPHVMCRRSRLTASYLTKYCERTRPQRLLQHESEFFSRPPRLLQHESEFFSRPRISWHRLFFFATASWTA